MSAGVKPKQGLADYLRQAADAPGMIPDYARLRRWADEVEAALRAQQAGEPVRMPKSRDVGRRDEMSPDGWLRVLFDGDGDLIVAVWGGAESDLPSVSVEFCTIGMGGGRSPRTREALIALMVAMEDDNADTPHRAYPPVNAGRVIQKGGEDGR